MEILNGLVKWNGRDDIPCTYGKTEDGKQYYFLKDLKNGNHIVTTVLIEAVDPMTKAKNIGLIDNDGNIIIPCVNSSIKVVDEEIAEETLLVEPVEAVSENVKEANALRQDPLSATRLVSTPAKIKEKINVEMSPNGRYLANDQFKDVTVYDANGNNLVNNEYYSFIARDGDKLFMAKNTPETDVVKFNLSTKAIDIPVETTEPVVDNTVVETPVTESTVEESTEVVPVVEENVVENTTEANVNEGFAPVDVDAIELPTDQIVNEEVTTPVVEEVQTEPVTEEISTEAVGEPITNIITDEVTSNDSIMDFAYNNEVEPIDYKLSDQIVEETPETGIDETESTEVSMDESVDESATDNIINNSTEEEKEFTPSDVKIDSIDRDYDYEEDNYSRSEGTTPGEQLESFVGGLVSQIDELTQEKNRMSKALENANKRIDSLEEENDILKEDNEKLQSKNRDQAQIIDLQKRESAELRRENNRLRSRDDIERDVNRVLSTYEDYSYPRRRAM